MNRVGTALVLVSLVAALACGSGGGGGGASTVVASFDPVPPSKSTDAVSMSEFDLSGGTVTVSVDISGTQAVSGAAFDVMFDTGNVTWLDWDPGTALEQGGASPIYTVSPTAGGIVVGVARPGGSTTNISGTKPLIRLTFQVEDVGTFDLTIVNQELYGSGSPPSSKPGIEWSAGSLIGV
jgi:hypothetical protein